MDLIYCEKHDVHYAKSKIFCPVCGKNDQLDLLIAHVNLQFSQDILYGRYSEWSDFIKICSSMYVDQSHLSLLFNCDAGYYKNMISFNNFVKEKSIDNIIQFGPVKV